MVCSGAPLLRHDASPWCAVGPLYSGMMQAHGVQWAPLLWDDASPWCAVGPLYSGMMQAHGVQWAPLLQTPWTRGDCPDYNDALVARFDHMVWRCIKGKVYGESLFH